MGLSKTLSFKNLQETQDQLEKGFSKIEYRTSVKKQMSEIFRSFFPEDDFLMEYFGGSVIHNQIFDLFFSKKMELE